MDVGAELEHGRFRILSLLGKGGMGHVYRAHDAQLQRDVALKTLYDVAPEDAYQLKREFRTLASFSHRHVVQLYELFADDHGCFFTMELLEGESLLDHLRSGMDRGESLDGASLEE